MSAFSRSVPRSQGGGTEIAAGCFSLVVIDKDAEEALLAIDRFGIQTLVYQADAQGLIFGSNCNVVPAIR